MRSWAGSGICCCYGFPSEHDRLQRPENFRVPIALCWGGGAGEFLSVDCVPTLHLRHRVGLSTPPCGRVLLLVSLCQIYFGREEETFLSWSISAWKSPTPSTSPCGSQTLPCICGGLGGRFLLLLPQRGGIMQVSRSKNDFLLSSQGKRVFPTFSQPWCVFLCALGADGCAIPSSAAQGLTSWS